jgi:hypothetical protein
MADAGKMRDRVIERIATKSAARQEGDELVRRPVGDELVGIIRARPALATAAPSFRLEFGEARVKQAEAEAADAALAEAGSSFQFGGIMASNRAQPVYTHVVVDPRNSDKVMGKYQSAAAARRGRDRLDNIYGAYRYQVKEIDSGEVRMSNRVKLADDASAQEKFLQRKAEEAGYADVDEFVDQDYEGFVEAAAQWRQENPADVMFSSRSIKRQRLVGSQFVMDSSSGTDQARVKLQDDALRMKRVIEVQVSGRHGQRSAELLRRKHPDAWSHSGGHRRLQEQHCQADVGQGR